jgi:hypothetical protein
VSRFPSAYLSYTAPRDFFDNVGRNAPVARISVGLPSELVDHSAVGQDPPYTLQPVDPQILTQIQSAVLRQYGGVARQYLAAFRQGRELSGLGLVNRNGSLDNGVGMRYSSQFGNEYIDIVVSPEAVRKLLGEAESDLYMLILYGTNQIAYIPMGSISSPAGKVTKKTLGQSDWSPPQWFTEQYWFNDYGAVWQIPIFQAKLSNDWHVLTANMEISADGVISIPDVNDQTPVYNTKDTILRSAKSTTPYSSATFDTPLLVTFCVTMIMNGSGRTMYNDRQDKFEWTAKDGVKRTATYSDNQDNLITLTGSGYSYYKTHSNVAYITTEGGRYSDIFLQSFGTSWWGNPDKPITKPQNAARKALYNYEYPGYINDLATPADTAGYYGPDNADVNIQTFGPSPPSSSFGGSYSFNSVGCVPVWAKSDSGIDKLNYGACNVTMAFNAGQFGGISTGWNYQITGYFGYSDSFSDYDYKKIRQAQLFPPSLGTKSDEVYFLSTEGVSSSDSPGFLQTPFEKITFGSWWYDFYFYPWMHVSNGKHLMQGYQSVGGPKIWLDKVNYGNTLASAIGCQLNEIRGVFFDIKKSDIDKLK